MVEIKYIWDCKKAINKMVFNHKCKIERKYLNINT